MDGDAKPKIITPADAASELRQRRKIRTNFHTFLKDGWAQFEFGRTFVDSWAVGAVCEHCQAVVQGEIEDLLINIPPRSTKSTIVSVCLLPWAWIDWPELQVMAASYADSVANNDHVKCRRLIESEWYGTINPQIVLADDQNTKFKFDNTLGGYRVRTSTDGATTGQGGDLLIIDDPNSAKDVTDTALANVLQWWNDVLPSRHNDPNNAMRIVVQQRVHEKDISGEITRNGGPSWVKLILPMEFETKRACVTVTLPSTGAKRWRDPRTKEGELLFPERVDLKALAKMKRTMSSYAAAGQLQQRPAPGDGGIIKRKWFQIWDQPTPPKIEFSILSVDTAMSEEDEAAYSAATVWGVFRHPRTGTPCAILLTVWRDQVDYPDLRKRIIRLARNYLDDGPLDGKPKKFDIDLKPTMTLIEAKNNGISLIQEMSRSDITVTRFNPDKLGDKTSRVKLITPMMESKRVWVPGDPRMNFKEPRPWAIEFIDQAISFPKAASRDLVDTTTQALWRLHMSGWIWNEGDPGEEPVYTNPGGEDDRPIYG